MSSPRLSWHLFIYSRALQIRYAIIWRVTTDRRHDGIPRGLCLWTLKWLSCHRLYHLWPLGRGYNERRKHRKWGWKGRPTSPTHPQTLSSASPCAITGARHEEWVGGVPHRIAAQHNDEWERFPVRDPITRIDPCKKTLFTQEAEDYTDSDNQDEYVDRRRRSCWLTGESQSSL